MQLGTFTTDAARAVGVQENDKTQKCGVSKRGKNRNDRGWQQQIATARTYS